MTLTCLGFHMCFFTDVTHFRLSLTRVIQELFVGEIVRSFTCPALPLQEQPHAVPRRVSDAATPQGLCDPQQLAHTSRDGLQGAQQGLSPFIKYMLSLYNLYLIS